MEPPECWREEDEDDWRVDENAGPSTSFYAKSAPNSVQDDSANIYQTFPGRSNVDTA
jgi:hypothetical protein